MNTKLNINDNIFNIIEHIGICNCNINILNILLELLPDKKINNLINEQLKNNTLINDDIYVENLNVKKVLCKIHDDKTDFDFWYSIKYTNLKEIFLSNEKNNLDKFNEFNKFNKFNHDNNTIFIHFKNNDITSNIKNIIKQKYSNKININGYCCSGKGLSLNLNT